MSERNKENEREEKQRVLCRKALQGRKPTAAGRSGGDTKKLPWFYQILVNVGEEDEDNVGIHYELFPSPLPFSKGCGISEVIRTFRVAIVLIWDWRVSVYVRCGRGGGNRESFPYFFPPSLSHG